MMQSLLFEFSHVWLLYDTDTGLARIRERALARSQRQEGEGEEEHDGEVRREMFRRKNHCHRRIRYVNDHMHSSPQFMCCTFFASLCLRLCYAEYAHSYNSCKCSVCALTQARPTIFDAYRCP